MFGRLFAGLQNHGLVGKTAVAVVTAVALLDLAEFFIHEVVEVGRRLIDLFA
jgi:hypothetical protein